MIRKRIREGDWKKGEISLLKEVDIGFENPYVRVYNDWVAIADRRNPATPLIFQHIRLTTADRPDGSVVIPITPDNKLLLVKQFRHAPRLWMTEFPRGFADRREIKIQTAVREMFEETGYLINWKIERQLGRIVPDSGKLHDAPYIYVVRAGKPHNPSPPKHDLTEAISEVIEMSFSDLLLDCQRGKICDGFTLAAMLRLMPHISNDAYQFNGTFVEDSPLEEQYSNEDFSYIE